MFRHGHRMIAFLPIRYIDVAPHEVHETRTLNQDMRQPGIVIAFGRHMAIGASASFLGSNGVGYKRAESLPAIPFGGNRLLLVVTPVTIGILRTDKNGAGRTHGRYSMAGNRTVYSQHVD